MNETDQELKHNQSIVTKIEELETQIDLERINLENSIDLITDITFKKQALLTTSNKLKQQQAQRWKNRLIKILTFGCYNRKQKIGNQLKTIEITMNDIQQKETKLNHQFQNSKLKRQNLINQIAHLKNFSNEQLQPYETIGEKQTFKPMRQQVNQSQTSDIETDQLQVSVLSV